MVIGLEQYLADILDNISYESTQQLAGGDFKIYVDKAKLKSILHSLKENPEYSFDMLLSIVAMDNGEFFELSYLLYSSALNEKLVVAVQISRIDSIIETVSDLYKSANWDEREIFDLFGITFTFHPNMKRLLMPKDWIGYPLRKDYELNDERLAWNK